MKQRVISAGAGLALLLFQMPFSAAQEQPSEDEAPQDATETPVTVLSGGASALTETHGDWAVNCQVIGNNKVCVLSHQQFDQAKNQRLLAIELSSRTGEEASGTIALPFGLELSSGITLAVEERPAQTKMAFKTCFPIGCVVPVNWDKAFVARLKANKLLKVGAVASDTHQPVTFTISLRGFSSAIARAAELAK